QVVIEERLEHIAPELKSRVAFPLQRPKIIGIGVYLAVPPGTHYEVVMVHLPFRFKGQVTMNRAPHVLLVPKALDPHRRYLRGTLRNQPVEGLSLPEGVVSRMFDHFLGPRQLIEAMQAS